VDFGGDISVDAALGMVASSFSGLDGISKGKLFFSQNVWDFGAVVFAIRWVGFRFWSARDAFS
jgi:hypothetical protein